jgi:hypothetical protein
MVQLVLSACHAKWQRGGAMCIRRRTGSGRAPNGKGDIGANAARITAFFARLRSD